MTDLVMGILIQTAQQVIPKDPGQTMILQTMILQAILVRQSKFG